MMDKRNEKIRPPPPLDRASFALLTELWIDKRNKFTPHLNSKINLDLNTQNFHQKPKLLTTIPWFLSNTYFELLKQILKPKTLNTIYKQKLNPNYYNSIGAGKALKLT